MTKSERDSEKHEKQACTDKPAQRKYCEIPTWSRSIDKQHRLVYQILEKEVVVLIISARGTIMVNRL